MFEHGTVHAILLHHASEELLCATCAEAIETMRTRSIMSMAMRAMSPTELRSTLRAERIGSHPRDQDNSERIRAWRDRTPHHSAQIV